MGPSPRSLAALDLLADAFAAVPDNDAVTALVADRLASLFDVDRVSIGRFHLGYPVRSYVPELVLTDDHDELRYLARTHPTVVHAISTRADRAFRLSDILSRRELHRLAIYHSHLRPSGVEHQLFCTLAGGHGRVPFFVALSRASDDFSEEDAALLDRLSAPLGHLLTAVAPTTGMKVTALTSREREIMHLIVLGMSNADVARNLNVRPATVKKHIENILAKYGVTSRSGAVAAWVAENGAPSPEAGAGSPDGAPVEPAPPTLPATGPAA